jgi:hypothetical protein
MDEELDDDEARQFHQKASNGNAADNNSVIYKSYKSEIDLTRNLTYLDAFLNEHFESSKAQQRQQYQQRQHKRSRTKNINYSPKNVHRHNQQRLQDNSKLFSSSSTMINDTTFDDMMMEDEHEQKKSFCDGNVTSSSFEYTTVIAKNGRRKNNKEFQDLINASGEMRPTTSSSLSSSDYASVFSNGSKEAMKTKLISTPEESVESNEIAKLPSKVKKSRARRSSQPIPELTNTIENENENEHFLLFDEANFTELKRSMKTLHPDLYNSVPQFEDINAVDFLADTTTASSFSRGNNGDCNDTTLINPFAVDPTNSTSAIGKRQLSSSYNVNGSSASIYHQDYLEHFQQQQMLGQRNDIDTSSGGGYIAMMRNGIRPRTSTYSSSNHSHNEISLVQDSLLYNNIGSVNDLYGSRKVHSQSISSSYGPHRVIVSKSKKQKGEVVLEYEC